MTRQDSSLGRQANTVRAAKKAHALAAPSPLKSEQLALLGSVGTGEFDGYLSALSFRAPEKIVPSAWHEHAPFAFRLIEALKPKIVVELGTHNGFSHFAFCQAIRMAGLGAAAFAVDRWTGDEHAGFYGEDVFQSVSDYSNEHYADISNLMRMSFSDALAYFDESSIDLLHVDGQHFYADVKADFESWLPKLSANAVVLFHDINVREREFGVFRFWSEISRQYPHFSFLHGHGLGVLGVGENAPPALSALFDSGEVETASIRNAYARLGAAVTLAFRASEATNRFDAAQRETEVLRGQRAAVERRIEDLTAEQARLVAKADQAIASQNAEIERLGAELDAERLKAAEQLAQIAESERLQESAFAEMAESRRLSEAAIAAAAEENSALRSERQSLRQKIEDLTIEQVKSRDEAEQAAATQKEQLERLAVALSAERQKTAELNDLLAEAENRQGLALTKLAAINESHNRLVEEIANTNEQLAESLAGESAQKARADRAEAAAAELDCARAEILERLVVLEAELADAQEKEQHSRQTAESLRAQLAASAAAIDEMASQLARVEQAILNTRAELAAATTDLANTRSERDRQKDQLDGALRKVELLTQDIASAHSERIRAQRAAHDLTQEARRLDLERQSLAARLSTVDEERRALELSRDELSLEAARQRSHFESSAVHHFNQISDFATKLEIAHAQLRDLRAKQEESAVYHSESLGQAQRESRELEQALESERAERAHLEAARSDLASRLDSLEDERRALTELNERTTAEAARRQRNFETDSVNHFTEVARLSSDLTMARAELGRFERSQTEQATKIAALRAQLVDAEAGAARAAARDKAPALAVVAEPFLRLWRAWALKRSGLFDPIFYRTHYPDCEAARLSPFKHYVTIGFARGHKPNAFFDTHWYLEKYEDVRLSGANPLVHYWLHGWKEARDPGPNFSTEKYLHTNPDVRASGKNPLAHYLLHGMREERRLHRAED